VGRALASRFTVSAAGAGDAQPIGDGQALARAGQIQRAEVGRAAQRAAGPIKTAAAGGKRAANNLTAAGQSEQSSAQAQRARQVERTGIEKRGSRAQHLHGLHCGGGGERHLIGSRRVDLHRVEHARQHPRIPVGSRRPIATRAVNPLTAAHAVTSVDCVRCIWAMRCSCPGKPRPDRSTRLTSQPGVSSQPLKRFM